MPTTPDIMEEIEREFDAGFDLDCYGNSHIVQDKVKSFIRGVVFRVREATLDEVRERARELQKNNQFTPCARCRGGFQPFCSCMPYRSALSDLISSLKQ